VKYTPQGGSISVKVKTGETSPASVSISVEDSGPGISEERQEAMFQPFMQGLASQGGMGIGLFTAHEMAITHHGQLSYTRLPNGSLFTFEIPCDDGAYDNDEQVSLPQSDANDHETEDFVKQMSPQALNDLTIAIIEDDPDMLEQLRTELGIFFRIAAYANGQAGFEAVSQQPPALLICDVMLPDLNGYDIVAHLRQQPSTTTLPIIMLTALADERHQLQAYKAGADDYMVKPCNFRLLVARAMQLLKWRGLKQDEATADPETSVHIKTEPPSPASPLIISQADKVFFDKLAMLTAQHLSEATFSVDRLADLMSMGRTKFYGKVKEMTGLSPNKYLMQERMKKAADLLADGELNISEVSYRVGIQDPSYFNKCFKAHFGVVPSKYVKPA